MLFLENKKEEYLELVTSVNDSIKKNIHTFFDSYEKNKKTRFVKGIKNTKQYKKISQIEYLDLSKEKAQDFSEILLNTINLKALDLSNTDIKNLQLLKHLKGLECLILKDCWKLNKLNFRLKSLRNLKILILTGTNIEELPISFFKLNNLVFCDLSNNELFEIGLSQSLSFPNLVQFDLSNNQLYRVGFDSLNELKDLDLSSNLFSSLPEDLILLNSLSQLSINNNHINTLPKALNKLVNLEILIAHGCNFLDFPVLNRCKKFTELHLGDLEMKNIPIGVFSNKNLVSLCIKDSKIKELPSLIEDLTNLNYLKIESCSLIFLPDSIGNLEELVVLELSNNRLSCLPKTIGNLKKLEILNVENSQNGKNNISTLPTSIGQLSSLLRFDLSGNRLSSLPTEIGNLKSLTFLDLSENLLEYLPSEIGGLSNLSSLFINENPLKSLPLEFSDLSKLTSFFKWGIDFEKDPVLKNMGIDELFKYLNKQRGIGEYSFIWKIPKPLQTAFQQYFNFFTDYFFKLTGKKIALDVIKIPEGLKLSTEASKEITIEQIENELNDYFNYINEKAEFKELANYNDPKLELLKIQMEGQINHFKQQARQAEFEVKYLKRLLEKSLDTNLNFSHSFKHLDRPTPSNQDLKPSLRKDKIKQLVSSGKMEQAIEELAVILKNDYPQKVNELIMLNGRYNRVSFESRLGTSNQFDKNRELNQIAFGVLEILDTLN